MRVDYFAQRPLVINNSEIPLGSLIATVEVPDGIPIEKAVNAIAVGHATPDRPETAAEKAQGALEFADGVKVMDEGHDR